MKPETGVYRLSPTTFSIVVGDFDTKEEAEKYLSKLVLQEKEAWKELELVFRLRKVEI